MMSQPLRHGGAAPNIASLMPQAEYRRDGLSSIYTYGSLGILGSLGFRLSPLLVFSCLRPSFLDIS